MFDPLNLGQSAALFGVGVAAGFLNVVAGGGSLLVMPLLVFLGVPEGVANGTTRVAILVQNSAAVWRYRRDGRLDSALVLRLVPAAVVGALVGAAVASRLPDSGIRTILGWATLGCALLVVWSPKQDDGIPRQLGLARVVPLMLAIGFYGGVIQAGVGYLILAGMVYVLRLPLLEANITKVVLVFAYTPIALAVFLWAGKVDLWLAVPLSLGQALGGLLGAEAALKRGERLIRWVLFVVIVATALKLLLD